MKNKIFTALLFTFLTSLGTAVAQNINKLKMDSLFDKLNEKNKAMGSICISKNGTVLYRNVIGYSMIAENAKITATNSSKYRIGSITKMFTATMIFQLIDAGQLKLDNTLDTYFPQIPNAHLITIGNLLNHRSGLHNFTDNPDYINWHTQPKSQEEILTLIAKNKVDFQPNEDAAYSNTNYVLLGFILEKITKTPYSKNLHSHITSKIGLSNTYVGDKINIKSNECFSYDYVGSWKQETETDMSIPGGAGNIVSTPSDLTKFIEALFGYKLITKNSLLQMKTITDNFGMGMFQYPFYSKKAYGHKGGIDGFGSMLSYFPEDSLAIAYTGNGQVYPINDIIIGVLSIYFDKSYEIPSFNSIVLKSEVLDKYCGIYSSLQLPLKITISKDQAILIAQATGQSSFPLENTKKDVFEFNPAGILITFNPDKNEMTLNQGGGVFLFTKDK